MKASEHIKQVQKMIDEYGDCEIVYRSHDDASYIANTDMSYFHRKVTFKADIYTKKYELARKIGDVEYTRNMNVFEIYQSPETIALYANEVPDLFKEGDGKFWDKDITE